MIIIIALVVAVVVWILFNKNPAWHEYVCHRGEIARPTIVSGVNVIATLIILYAIAGALYGMAGVLEAARTGGATNNYGNMYELDAIAACVVGGVSTTGGVGTVPGVLGGGAHLWGYQLRPHLYWHKSLLAAHREGAYHRGGGLLRYPQVHRQEIGPFHHVPMRNPRSSSVFSSRGASFFIVFHAFLNYTLLKESYGMSKGGMCP